MNQITNSPIKEAMRVQNVNEAQIRESQIRSKLSSDLSQIVYKNKFTGGVCTVLIVVFGMIGAVNRGTFEGFVKGAVVGAVIYILMNVWVKSQNSSADEEVKRLKEETQRRVQEAYDEADRKTIQQINAYDREVKQYCQKILQKKDAIASMVQHNTDMFQRMVSHADMGSNMRFVESDFTYKVQMTGIMYSYQSKYTNPQDDYNFDKQRFRNLNSNSECEGLAQALAKLTIKRMMGLYPPNSLHITVSHTDAEVTLHYKAANKNFVAARDIF